MRLARVAKALVDVDLYDIADLVGAQRSKLQEHRVFTVVTLCAARLYVDLSAHNLEEEELDFIEGIRQQVNSAQAQAIAQRIQPLGACLHPLGNQAESARTDFDSCHGVPHQGLQPQARCGIQLHPFSCQF